MIGIETMQGIEGTHVFLAAVQARNGVSASPGACVFRMPMSLGQRWNDYLKTLSNEEADKKWMAYLQLQDELRR